MASRPLIFGVVGRSGSGKTTLIEAMVQYLAEQGLEVAVIKHSHHRLSFEPAHKDSARFRSAGAREVIIGSPYGYAVFHTPAEPQDPTLDDLLVRLPQGLDLVLVEGYRAADIPRLEVHRPGSGLPPLYPEALPGLIAIASDAAIGDAPAPVLDLNQPQAIAQYIVQQHPGLAAKAVTLLNQKD